MKKKQNLIQQNMLTIAFLVICLCIGALFGHGGTGAIIGLLIIGLATLI